jgi:hypothetical protein
MLRPFREGKEQRERSRTGRLSEWISPPPAARASGYVEPIRCFDSAQAALRFLAGRDRPPRRVLEAESRERLLV